VHNQLNALAAIAAAEHVGVPPAEAARALASFQNVKRRMEVCGRVAGAGGDFTVYDDFAHHPTAIRTTVDGLRRSLAPGARILAVFEPRSNTMKLGAMKAQLPWSLEAADLGLLLDEYYRSFPALRRTERVTWCFDEIQIIPGWEKFVRRVMDSENVEIFLSGSSARMLSREVATTMRGRALETIITPFSFREFGRSRGLKVPDQNALMSAARQSEWLACFDAYLEIGGFPEAGQDAMRPHRVGLLQGYVDSVLFRDIAERHGISNISALRAFVRQLLRQSACQLSVTKIHADFRSRGISISKETLLALLAHLEDAFLVFTVPIASRSERRQQVNPRKLYVADHGLAAAYTAARDADRGHHFENMVACELLRQGMTLAYVKTAQGHEVDFLATAPDGSTQLIQVTSELDEMETFAREVRALQGAAPDFPQAKKLLISERLSLLKMKSRLNTLLNNI
jgi:predicted AAA+ superfamily ATPase